MAASSLNLANSHTLRKQGRVEMASADASRQRIGALAQSDVLCKTYSVLVHQVLQTSNQMYRPDKAYAVYPRVLFWRCIALKSCQAASLLVCVNKAVAIRS